MTGRGLRRTATAALPNRPGLRRRAARPGWRSGARTPAAWRDIGRPDTIQPHRRSCEQIGSGYSLNILISVHFSWSRASVGEERAAGPVIARLRSSPGRAGVLRLRAFRPNKRFVIKALTNRSEPDKVGLKGARQRLFRDLYATWFRERRFSADFGHLLVYDTARCEYGVERERESPGRESG